MFWKFNPIVEVTTGQTMISALIHWTFYLDKSHRWQWRKFDKGKVVAVSGDGFDRKTACVLNAVQRGYVLPPAISNPEAFSETKK